jgi:pilus assembly protein CpaE
MGFDRQLIMKKTILAFAENKEDKEVLTKALSQLDENFTGKVLSENFFDAINHMKNNDLIADIIIVGMSESGDILCDIDELADVCLPDTKVIVYADINDLNLYFDLKEVGVYSYMHKPLSEKILTKSLINTLVKNEDIASTDTKKQIKTIAVVGVNGGVGASTIAIKLANNISNNLQKETLLIDLDPWFSPLSFLFDKGTSSSIFDIFDNIDKIDTTYLKQVSENISPKFNIISQNCNLEKTDLSFLENNEKMQSKLPDDLDVCIYDISRYTLLQQSSVLNNVDNIVLIAESNISSARNTVRILEFIKANSLTTKVNIIINNLNSDSHNIGLEKFKTTTKTEILGAIKYNKNNYKSEFDIDFITKDKSEEKTLKNILSKLLPTQEGKKLTKASKKWWKVG